MRGGLYERYIKRGLDFFCALVFLLLFCWLYALLAVLVRRRLGTPVLFRQERPGKDEKIFTLYKFRTMTDRRDESGALLPDEERMTPFGTFLRSCSLDELPELWNILRGDMALVGPRPLLVKYLPLYNARQRRRHEVRPGLTGLAQVSGRNAITWEARFDLDVRYVDSVSFGGDVAILLRTVAAVFNRRGIHSATSCTMETFTGTPEPEEERI